MAEKTVYMIRHGVIRSNIEGIYSGRSDEPLTKEGAEEARRLGREMAGWGIRTIYTSPLARTVQTAQLLNESIGAELVLEPNLIEMDLGPWTGLSRVEVAKRRRSEYRTWHQMPAQFRASGMETLHDVQQRVVRALDEYLRVGPESIAAMVTHAAVIKCALLYLNELSLNSYHRFQVLNLSVHEAVFQGGKGSFRIIRKGSGPAKK
jgi:broad specificity phosphatase PhoE